MARRGRPRQSREFERALKELNKSRKDLAQKIRKSPFFKESPSSRAFVAARLLLTLERGKRFQIARCEPLIAELRGWVRVNGPIEQSRNDSEFLDQFIKKHAPGWNWRNQIDDGTLAAQNEQIAKENAVTYRTDRAKKERFFTANSPNIEYLHALKRLVPNDPTTWPTARDLKLATALLERRIEKIIASLSPNKNEVVVIALRHKFRKRGAFPKRFAPRLVRAVLQKFLKVQPSDSSRDKAEREAVRQAAIAAKRSLAAKLVAFR